MRRWIQVLTALLIIFGAQGARGHGEDKPGPHGGEIRMPGAFHTELRASRKGDVEVFLLDLEWRNPVVEGSSVKASIEGGGELVCKPREDRFACALPAGRPLAAGDVLVVTPARSGQEGVPVRYPFPFRSGGAPDGGESHGR